VAAEGQAIDALSQFRLEPAFGSIGEAVRFSQSNAHMLVAFGIIVLLMVWGTARRAIVPGRVQAIAESAYEFVGDMVVSQVGEEGMKYFPFVFTLFMFILVGNLLGMLPYGFTFTSHIAVTFALAMLVFVAVTLIAISIHGVHFLSYFFPEGAPKALAPLIIPIEIISYFSRPLSLSVRLFANMVAGHVMLKVFATFVVMIGSAAGIFGILGATLPLAINVILVGFELLVAFLQAYVFAILTCIYLHDAVHLH
jgi:F-type H+-transporting ATPase subunit a